LTRVMRFGAKCGMQKKRGQRNANLKSAITVPPSQSKLNHSERSACIGSTRMARRAGI
jgi:hypothetical protein